jgi:hypothetical protein
VAGALDWIGGVLRGARMPGGELCMHPTVRAHRWGERQAVHAVLVLLSVHGIDRGIWVPDLDGDRAAAASLPTARNCPSGGAVQGRTDEARGVQEGAARPAGRHGQPLRSQWGMRAGAEPAQAKHQAVLLTGQPRTADPAQWHILHGGMR